MAQSDLDAQNRFITARINDVTNRLDTLKGGIRVIEGGQQITDANVQAIQTGLDAFVKDSNKALADAKTENEKAAVVTQIGAAAAALPGIANGIVTVVDAARQTPPDAMAISAGVMDILGSIGSAAPPPFGAVLGALFSVVSIFLKAFAPKPADLVKQIETVVRTINAEDKKAEIKRGYETLEGYVNVTQGLMDYETPDPGKLMLALKAINLAEGNTIFAISKVRSWLETSKNQDQDQWPEILKFLCDSYLQLFLAVEGHSKYVRNFENYVKYNKSTSDEKVLATEWVELMADAEWRKPKGHDEGEHSTEFENWRALVNDADLKDRHLAQEKKFLAEFWEKVVPAARKWGLFVVAWENSNMYAAAGPDMFTTNKWGNAMPHGKTVSVSAPAGGITSLDSQYDKWVLSAAGNLTRDKITVGSRQHTSSNDAVTKPDEIVLNFCPVPGIGAGRKYTFYVTSKLWGVSRGVWNGSTRGLKGDGWMMETPQLPVQLCIAAGKALEDDIDKMPKRIADRLSKGASIIYARLGNSEVLVTLTDELGQKETRGVLKAPEGWDRGIAVDPYLLWIYGDKGFQCVTHASVFYHLEAGVDDRRWLGAGNPKSIPDIHALSSCEDGTLFVCTGAGPRAAPYRIDFEPAKTGRFDLALNVGTWQDAAGGGHATIVCKLPVFGWPQIQSLMKAVGKKPADYVT